MERTGYSATNTLPHHGQGLTGRNRARQMSRGRLLEQTDSLLATRLPLLAGGQGRGLAR